MDKEEIKKKKDEIFEELTALAAKITEQVKNKKISGYKELLEDAAKTQKKWLKAANKYAKLNKQLQKIQESKK